MKKTLGKNYGIVRYEKIKVNNVGGLIGRARHNLRLNDSEIKFNEERTKDNITLGAQTPKDILDKAKELWAKNSDKLRADAVGVVEVLVTTSFPLSKEKEKQFYKMVIRQLQLLYGKECLISCQVHFDENTPHLHAFLVPLEKKETNRTRYKTEEMELLKTELKKINLEYKTRPRNKKTKKNQKEWEEYENYVEKSYPIRKSLGLMEVKSVLNVQKIMGTKAILSAQQDMWYENVFKNFDLSRGEILKNPRKNGRSSLEKLKERLEKREESISQIEEQQQTQAESLSSLEATIAKQIKDNNDKTDELKKKDDELSDLENLLNDSYLRFQDEVKSAQQDFDRKNRLIKEWDEVGRIIGNADSLNWVDTSFKKYSEKRISLNGLITTIKEGIKGIAAKVKHSYDKKIKDYDRELNGYDYINPETNTKMHKYGASEITKMFSEASSSDFRKIAKEMDDTGSSSFESLYKKRPNCLERFFKYARERNKTFGRGR